jgi:predicted PurR-regulated permease PerM
MNPDETPRVVAAENAAALARRQAQALGWCALAALALVWWIVRSVAVGILLGTLAAFIVQPVYERMKPRLGAMWSSIVTSLGVFLLGAGFATFVFWAVITKGVSLAHDVFDNFQLDAAVRRFTELAATVTSRVGLGQADLEAKLREAGAELASWAAGLGAELASASASALLATFMLLLTVQYILGHWDDVSRRLEASLPLRPEYSHALFTEFRRAGRTTLLGTLVTGLAQGALATLGFVLAGLPRPLFFGVATALASLVPAVGTMLVWIPVALVLLLTHHAGAGVFMLVWGFLVIVGLSDYVIRPRLLGGEEKTPSLVTFAALFGGVEAFGLKGLILGPILMSLAVAVLRLYAREAAEERRAQARLRAQDETPSG